MSSPIQSTSFYYGKKAKANPSGLSKRKRVVRRLSSKKIVPAPPAAEQEVAPSSPAGSLPPAPGSDDHQDDGAVADQARSNSVDPTVAASVPATDPATATATNPVPTPSSESAANSPAAAATPPPDDDHHDDESPLVMDLDDRAEVSSRAGDFLDEGDDDVLIISSEEDDGGPASKKRRKSAMVILSDKDERRISQWLEFEGEFIYNKGLSSYKDKAKVAKAFARLGSRCRPPVSGDAMRTWFYSLRTRFGRLTTGKSGQGAMKRLTAREKWILDLFHFLKPHIVRQRRTAQIGLNEVSIFYLL